MHDQYDQSDDEKQMDERTPNVDRETEQPENDEHDTNGPEHKKRVFRLLQVVSDERRPLIDDMLSCLNAREAASNSKIFPGPFKSQDQLICCPVT